MKYRLIKTYPNSLDVGAIAEKHKHLETYILTGTKNLGYTTGIKIAVSELENYPEFWQRVEERDYEILSFVDKNHDKRMPHITKWANGLFGLAQGSYSEEYYLQRLDKFDIYSIKRISDGKVFSIGDKYKNATGIFTIEEFDYEKIIKAKEGGYARLDSISKPIKILTTSDGADIYEGQEYWYIRDDFNKWKLEYSKPNSRWAGGEIPKNFKYFSTKEIGEDWILYNKPILSYNDVMRTLNNCGDISLSKLLALTKSKI